MHLQSPRPRARALSPANFALSTAFAIRQVNIGAKSRFASHSCCAGLGWAVKAPTDRLRPEPTAVFLFRPPQAATGVAPRINEIGAVHLSCLRIRAKRCTWTWAWPSACLNRGSAAWACMAARLHVSTPARVRLLDQVGDPSLQSMPSLAWVLLCSNMHTRREPAHPRTHNDQLAQPASKAQIAPRERETHTQIEIEKGRA